MTYARSQHPNAPLTWEGRRRMVRCVVDQGWTVTATAERFQVDAKTVRKWRDRFLAEGDAGCWIGRVGRIGHRTGLRAGSVVGCCISAGHAGGAQIILASRLG
jgi:hypothetical protein